MVIYNFQSEKKEYGELTGSLKLYFKTIKSLRGVLKLQYCYISLERRILLCVEPLNIQYIHIVEILLFLSQIRLSCIRY